MPSLSEGEKTLTPIPGFLQADRITCLLDLSAFGYSARLALVFSPILVFSSDMSQVDKRSKLRFFEDVLRFLQLWYHTCFYRFGQQMTTRGCFTTTRPKAMKVERFSLCMLIATVLVLAGIVLLAASPSARQVHAKKLASYKHPYIVLKVNNQGCETEIKVRTRASSATQ